MNAQTKTSRPFADTVEALSPNGSVPPIFPCKPGKKEPATSHGFKDAARTYAEAQRLAAQYPDANTGLALELAGLCALDIDGVDGENALSMLELQYGPLPPTYEVKTPRGRHLYFRGSLPPTASKLGLNIDTRGRGSYVLAVGSIVNGITYEAANDAEPAELPDWITAKLLDAPRESQSAPTIWDLDSSENLARASDFLKSHGAAIEGEGGDSWTYKTAATLRDLGISEQRATALLIESGWNERCVPPWQADELAVKVGNAFAYAQNEPGAYAAPPAQEIFGELAKVAPTDAVYHADARVVILRNEATQDSRTPPRMLVDSFLPEVGTVALHAPFGSYKSFTATDVLLSVAANRPAFDHCTVRRTGSVIYMAGEGLAGFETLRRPAWRTARKIAGGQQLPIYSIDGVPLVRSPDDIKRYLDAIAQLRDRPVLVAIDPVARAMAGLNENDAGDAGLYLEMVEAMAKAFGCCVLSILHEGKEGERGIRGSSAFAAGFDNVWKQEADTDNMTAKLTPIKLKDDAGIGAICLKGRQVLVPRAGKASLVFDWMPADEFAGRGNVLTRSDVGKALRTLGEGPFTTHVLAVELAGPDADNRAIATVEKRLRRGAAKQLQGYVVQKGEGRGDATLWAFPDTENAETMP